jgi:hypothetical protein
LEWGFGVRQRRLQSRRSRRRQGYLGYGAMESNGNPSIRRCRYRAGSYVRIVMRCSIQPVSTPGVNKASAKDLAICGRSPFCCSPPARPRPRRLSPEAVPSESPVSIMYVRLCLVNTTPPTPVTPSCTVTASLANVTPVVGLVDHLLHRRLRSLAAPAARQADAGARPGRHRRVGVVLV